MNILLFGATGGTGSHILQLALHQGHFVTVVVRRPQNLLIKVHNNLDVIVGDILKPETYRDVIAKQDVVVSAIGSANLKPTNLFSHGISQLIELMNQFERKKIFCISASGIVVNPNHNFILRFATKYILQKIFNNPYNDIWKMEAILQNSSDIDYTIIRPPRLTNKKAKGNYRFAINTYLEKSFSITRADLAKFIVSNLANKEIEKSIVEASN